MDRRKLLLILLLEMSYLETICICTILVVMMLRGKQRHVERPTLTNRSLIRREISLCYLNGIIGNTDTECVNELRMDRRTFGILCDLLRQDGRVKTDGLVSVEEQVCMTLQILAHHTKNRSVGGRFYRSGETISRYFNSVLQGILRLQGFLLKVPQPVPIDSTDARWRCFKNCLGALDGTHIDVHVPEIDKPRYRTRKGRVATNVLGVCSGDRQFIYVFPGWEGSASDSRVLHDAISRPNGFKVPAGCYYLVDGGYTNGEGFLAPYRGIPYHLSEWEGRTPSNKEEYFNMKHSKARNVIERCFGLLKGRWSILRSPSFYPIRTQGRIITACCLLHNLIRQEMSVDPMENLPIIEDGQNTEEGEYVGSVQSSDQWTAMRNDMAEEMYNEWRAIRNQQPN
ncbi:protein ANTAGONIST OF LIKE HETEROCHROMATIN PROTEIN 1-like isoform X1 [Malus domestica]|uniref:protein ANTAGONIST OF LIKE HETEROCHROMATIN PROTEIN 1-like isoform X1 n=1 Tax=Malus domestica TaxID=3750 RepID=UPI003976FFFC